jgi:hypothetical protein
MGKNTKFFKNDFKVKNYGINKSLHNISYPTFFL